MPKRVLKTGRKNKKKKQVVRSGYVKIEGSRLRRNNTKPKFNRDLYNERTRWGMWWVRKHEKKWLA